MEDTTKARQVGGRDPSLELTAQHFARWREARRRGEHVPPALWTQAVELAEVRGVQRVADALRLDVERLGKRMQRQAEEAPVGEADPHFVELLTPTTMGPATTTTAGDVHQCVIDLRNAHGATMRVELAGGGLAALADLCRAFCGAR